LVGDSRDGGNADGDVGALDGDLGKDGLNGEFLDGGRRIQFRRR
jgi:hypothetical protein